jgi:hypothetical protein
MADYALKDVTLSSYADSVLKDFHRYALQPADIQGMIWLDADEHPVARTLSVIVTNVLYFAALIAGAVAFLWPRRLAASHQVVVLLTSLLTAALMIQPFVHVCTARYWPVFLPLLSLAAMTLTVRPDAVRSSVWLRRLQMVAGGAWLVVLLGLVLLAV